MATDKATMIVIDSDGYEENYVLISSSRRIIFNKISAVKNTVFLVKLIQYTTSINYNRSHSKSQAWKKTKSIIESEKKCKYLEKS